MVGRLVGSVRARVTIAATLAVALALILVSIFVVTATARAMVTDAQRIAEVQARNLAIVVEAGRAPAVLDVDAVGATILQVVDQDGEVVSASPQLARVPALADPPPSGVTESSTVRVVSWTGQPTDHRVAALGVDSPDGPVAVIAGASLADAQQTLDQLIRLFVLGLAAVILVVAVASWLVTGWALKPVDSIRREVDDLTEQELSRRVPVPRQKDEVHQLAVTMNRMLERLETATNQQKAFIADASHELRSPIASLRTQLEVATAHPDAFTTGELAEETLADVLRLQALADDLLQLARVDSGADQGGAVAPLGQTLDTLLSARPADRIPVQVAAHQGPEVRVESARFCQIVTNLLDNAVRHANSEVTISVRGDRDLVTVLVQDDGPGIAPQDRERIFERFVRLDTARSRTDGGTGLGLAIARDLAEAAGGDVRVVDSAQGAAFRLTLPTS